MPIQNDPNEENKNASIINPPVQNRQKGTGFTNINRILGANVGAGQQLAGRIGGAIGAQGERVRQNLGQAQQQFQTGFQQARQGALANIGSATALIRQPGETNEQYESRIAQQNNDFSQIGQNLRSTQYSGPTGFQNPNVLLSQAQTAGTLGTFARSGLGQGVLARQYGGGRGSYGVGQNILDQMFLSQDPAAQKMLQEARQGVVGLEQGVQSASAAAQEAAEATKAGIESAKEKATTDIQQSAKDILARGGQSAGEFNKEMESIKRLMLGVDEAGNPITNITPEQEALLSRMSDYGIANPEMYFGREDLNKTEIENILNQVAQGMVLNPSGALKLTETQRQAAMNLARLQNDPTLQKQLLENKFDTNVFKKDVSKISADIGRNRKEDIETRDILTRAGEYMKGEEERATQQNIRERDLKLNALGNPEDWLKQYGNSGKIYYEQAKDAINKSFEDAQNLLMGKSGNLALTAGGTLPDFNFMFDGPNQEQLRKAQEQQNLLKMMQSRGVNLDGYIKGFDYDEGRGKEIYENLNKAFGGNYGWLAFGDRSADMDYGGPESIDPRFRGLGLTGTKGRGSGGFRTSEDFLNAAKKALGQSKTVKDIILERIAKNRSNL